MPVIGNTQDGDYSKEILSLRVDNKGNRNSQLQINSTTDGIKLFTRDKTC